jgi:hypothetical protein
MNKRTRPILMGQAEEIDLLLPEIRKMLETEGFYLASDTANPIGEVPLVVMQGKVFCMKIDTELDPERFLKTVKIAGPFRAT